MNVNVKQAGAEGAALADFYTVHEYVALPGDRVMHYAGNAESGIGCPGRETVDLAMQDAEALNAAAKRARGGDTPCGDPHVEAVVALLRARARRGLAKYGTTLARGDLDRLAWIQHLQDELLDAANYAERLKSVEGGGA